MKNTAFLLFPLITKVNVAVQLATLAVSLITVQTAEQLSHLRQVKHFCAKVLSSLKDKSKQLKKFRSFSTLTANYVLFLFQYSSYLASYTNVSTSSKYLSECTNNDLTKILRKLTFGNDILQWSRVTNVANINQTQYDLLTCKEHAPRYLNSDNKYNNMIW